MTDLTHIDEAAVGGLSDDALMKALAAVASPVADDRRHNAILYYEPVSDAAAKVHSSEARIVGIGGGNRASKTTTALVDMIARATGIFPEWNRDVFAKRFCGPLRQRVICESLTTTLEPIILPKLQWWTWNGLPPQGGERGHWGFVPRWCLKNGSWAESWSSRLRTLTVLCRNPDNPDEVIGESTLQGMSFDQDPSDFASGSFHDILHDEPPPHAIWRESQARVMDVGGRNWLAMTWPDDPSIPVDWIYDEVYDRRGEDGIDWFEIWTEHNKYLDQKVIAETAAGWDKATRNVRLYGQPIRFSNRIHPLFTDLKQWWCFVCCEPVVPIDGRCPCGSEDIEAYNHVVDFEHFGALPVVFLLDPHPRKPHMFMWVQIDAADDYWVVADGELDGTPIEVREMVDEIETEFGFNVMLRLVDPNMGRSPSSAARRELTWQEEFADAGLALDLADDSGVGRSRVNEYLRVDERTRTPRLRVHERCHRAIHQMKRYTWDEHRGSRDKDLKQIPRDKYSDYPTLLKYLMNYLPTFSMLRDGAPVITRAGTRKGSY